MRLGIGLVFCIVGTAIYAIPNMTRRSVLFGLTVPADFRESAAARKSIAAFRALVALTLAAALLALFAASDNLLELVTLAGPLLILLAGGIGFLWGHRKTEPFAVDPSFARAADITNAPERLPWFVWLGPGPLLFLAAAAGFLYLNWERIPLHFPVHWGANGKPNGWSERNFHGVYGPILFGAEICAWMLIMGLATWFGARRSKFRRVTLGALIALGYMLGLLFAATSLQPLLKLPIWAFLLGPVVVIVPILIAMANALAEPGESAEPTPNECWKAGAIYYNPNDPALFVEKRTGLGYTFNFANRWCWLLMVGLLAVIGTAPLLK